MDSRSSQDNEIIEALNHLICNKDEKLSKAKLRLIMEESECLSSEVNNRVFEEVREDIIQDGLPPYVLMLDGIFVDSYEDAGEALVMAQTIQDYEKRSTGKVSKRFIKSVHDSDNPRILSPRVMR